MGKVTAVVKLYAKETKAPNGVFLAFNADYSNDQNKEWAKFTPSMNLGMTVKEEVADLFDFNETYLLTFEKQ